MLQLGVTIICLISWVSVLVWQYTSLSLQVEETTKRVVERLSESVESPLWQMNYRQVERVVSAEIRDPMISRVVVYEIQNRTLQQIVNQGENSEGVLFKRQISKNGRQIGVIEVQGSSKWINDSFTPLALIITVLFLVLEILSFVLVRAFSKSYELRVEAERANAAKSEFLANISHELRTPLTGIIGLASILIDDNLKKEHRDMIGTLKDSGENLLRIINDLLDLTKIDAGKIILNPSPFSPRQCLEGALRLLEVSANKKEITLVTEIERLPVGVIGDEHRITQILYNLIGNAIKFTPEGGSILIVGEWINGNLLVHITDTGMGIPLDKQSRIFEPFVQADGSVSKKFGGTGLGLTITKRLVNLMGGELSLHSRPDLGARFSVSLPTPISELGDVKSEPVKTIDGKRILIVEDNKVNQMVVKKILEKRGVNVELANDGSECLEKMGEGKFDLVLMDLHMPGMSGVDAINELRLSEETTPIVVLTADVIEAQKCKNDSFIKGVCTKPFKTEELIKVIGELVL